MFRFGTITEYSCMWLLILMQIILRVLSMSFNHSEASPMFDIVILLHCTNATETTQNDCTLHLNHIAVFV